MFIAIIGLTSRQLDAQTPNSPGSEWTPASILGASVCGNGIREVGEICDYAEPTIGTACSQTCRLAVQVEPLELTPWRERQQAAVDFGVGGVSTPAAINLRYLGRISQYWAVSVAVSWGGMAYVPARSEQSVDPAALAEVTGGLGLQWLPIRSLSGFTVGVAGGVLGVSGAPEEALELAATFSRTDYTGTSIDSTGGYGSLHLGYRSPGFTGLGWYVEASLAIRDAGAGLWDIPHETEYLRPLNAIAPERLGSVVALTPSLQFGFSFMMFRRSE